MELDVDAVRGALVHIISREDYDLHKAIERDEDTEEDHYPELVEEFISVYMEIRERNR